MFPPLLLIIAIFLVVFGINSDNPLFQHVSTLLVILMTVLLIVG